MPGGKVSKVRQHFQIGRRNMPRKRSAVAGSQIRTEGNNMNQHITLDPPKRIEGTVRKKTRNRRPLLRPETRDWMGCNCDMVAAGWPLAEAAMSGLFGSLLAKPGGFWTWAANQRVNVRQYGPLTVAGERIEIKLADVLRYCVRLKIGSRLLPPRSGTGWRNRA
jgi:hypothetical protein